MTDQLNPLPRVSIGADQFLYLIGGSNSTIDLYRPGHFQNMVNVDKWHEILRVRSDFCAEIAIPWLLILAPEKLSVIGANEVRRWVSDAPECPGDRFVRLLSQRYERHNNCLFYPREVLQSDEVSFDTFSRSDSHWTSEAAFHTFVHACKILGVDLDPRLILDAPSYGLSYRGDLWSPDLGDLPMDRFVRRKVPDSIKIIYKNPVMGLKDIAGLENEGGLHVGSHIIWHNSAAHIDKSIVVFGSSFSEARLECSLISFAAAFYFRETHFIWSSNFDRSYIRRHQPDMILSEVPERFLTQVPDDEISVEEASYRTMRKWLSRQEPKH